MFFVTVFSRVQDSQMESNIVQDFQNLRVFSNHNVNKMDDLVQDLSLALEETAKACVRTSNSQENRESSAGAIARRYHKRRRGTRRAAVAVYWKRGTISEASESSVEEGLRDFKDTNVVTTHSDSDELSLSYHPKQRLSVPVTEPVPPVESDSFTENLSPMRPQRRRRRYKHMAMDSYSADNTLEREKRTHHYYTPTCQASSSHELTSSGPYEIPGHSRTVVGSSYTGSVPTIVPGKRKRCSKSRTDMTLTRDGKGGEKDEGDMDNMEITSVSQ